MSNPRMAVSQAARWRARVESTLDAVLPSLDATPQRLHAAMRHAALASGKRMRPLLVYATGSAFGADESALDAAAGAVELIHAYSLVHDDLPSMDDDALRRGQPTVHVAFDEGTAILAGDALQSLAFELLASAKSPAEIRVAMLHELATAAGVRGMCGGQALDLDATGSGKRGQSEVSRLNSHANQETRRDIHSDPFSLQSLERLHSLKTGALLRASVRLGAIAAQVDADTCTHLDVFADALGLAFQIRDDLLDVESDSATLGKTAGKDTAQAKATFPALIGIAASRERLLQLAGTMHEALLPFGGRTHELAELGRQVIARNR